jgi:hypothetical protein
MNLTTKKYSYVQFPAKARQGKARQGIIFFTTGSRKTLVFTQSSIQINQGILSPEINQPGSDSDHFPEASAELKSSWGYTPIPPSLHCVVLN